MFALMRRLLPVLLALHASSGFAKELLAIADLDAPPHLLGLSSQVVRAALAEAANQKQAVLNPEQLLEKLGPDKLRQLAKCGDQPACAQSLLEGTGATRVVLGRLSLNDKNYLLKLWLIDVSQMQVLAEVDRAVLIASRRLQKDVEAAMPALLRGEREARGTLRLQVTVANAQVSINGEFIGATPLGDQKLKPGKYEVRVEKNKYLPVTRLVDVEADQVRDEEIRLLLKPGERPDEETLPPMAAAPEKSEERAFHLSAPTWVFGALTIAGAAVGVGFGLKSSNADKELLRGYDGARDVYAGTRADALGAQRDALIANIGFGVAGAGLIATVVFAVLDAKGVWAPPADLQVAPAASQGAGGFVLGGRF